METHQPPTGQAGTDSTRCATSNLPSPELLKDREAAALLGIGARTLHRLCDAGKAPRPVKLGGSVRWRRAELLGWLADGCPVVRTVKTGGAA